MRKQLLLTNLFIPFLTHLNLEIFFIFFQSLQTLFELVCIMSNRSEHMEKRFIASICINLLAFFKDNFGAFSLKMIKCSGYFSNWIMTLAVCVTFNFNPISSNLNIQDILILTRFKVAAVTLRIHLKRFLISLAVSFIVGKLTGRKKLYAWFPLSS